MRSAIKLILITLVTASGSRLLASDSISLDHRPLVALRGDVVHIKVSGIFQETVDSLTIHIIVGRMIDCGEIKSDYKGIGIPCRTNVVTFEHECKFGGVAPPGSLMECSYSEDFTTRTEGWDALVSYWASASRSTGNETSQDALSSSEVSFAQGNPDAPQAEPIAWPVWWYRRAPLSDKVDLGFFRDSDYGEGIGYELFRQDLEVILEKVLDAAAPFNYPMAIGHNYFNLWMIMRGGELEQQCKRSFVKSIDPILAILDGRVIVHQDSTPDCSSIAQSGAGSVRGSAGDAAWILMHEMGHFLYGQGDEYACDGSFDTALCENVFKKRGDCEIQAQPKGALCEALVCNGVEGAWHVHNEGKIIMRDRGLDSDWSPLNRQCVSLRNAGRFWPGSFFRSLSK